MAEEQGGVDYGELPETPVAAITLTWKRGEGRFVCDLRGVSVFAAKRMMESALSTMEYVLPDTDLQLDDRFISVSGFDQDGLRLPTGPGVVMGLPASVDVPGEAFTFTFDPEAAEAELAAETYDDPETGDDPPCQSA